MDRRSFTQLLTLGAGSLGLFQAGADEKPRRRGAASDGRPGDIAASNGGRNGDAGAEAVNVADFQALSQARLPRATFEYISTGSGDEFTLRENVAAFQRIGVLPPLLKGVTRADASTTVLGQRISLPLMLAPVAVQRMFHPEGALAAARAAAAADTVFGVSSSACNSVEEIARASSGPKWFQLYVPKDRTIARRLIQRVERAGYQAIILTVDLGESKDSDRRNRFALPKEMLVKHLRDVGFEQVSDRMEYEELLEFNLNAWDISLSWSFFEWLRSVTRLPLLIKGVLRKEDAVKAVSIGLQGIIVSNHGGRRLDGMPATINMLPDIVDAVGGKAEVFLDGGVRRGTDVLKALALGARAVLIGRPYAWALSADGENGVRKVIELLRDEFLNSMVACGCATVNDISRNLLLGEPSAVS